MHSLKNHQGYTLIELVVTITMLAVLAAVGVPMFVDFRVDAKNAATRGSLGGMRAALANARALILLKDIPIYTPATCCNVNYYRYVYYKNNPTPSEMNTNTLSGSDAWTGLVIHPNTSGLFMSQNGIPANPWSKSTYTTTQKKYIFWCDNCAVASLQTVSLTVYGLGIAAYSISKGWLYDPRNGKIWANTANNGAGGTKTENYY